MIAVAALMLNGCSNASGIQNGNGSKPTNVANSTPIVPPATPAQAPKPPTVALTLDPRLQGNTLFIAGTTDLPEGALISYEVRHEGLSRRTDVALEKMFAEGDAKVSKGTFTTRVDLTGWPTGRVEVWSAFQTILGGSSKQPPDVIARFGEQGELLQGSNVTTTGAMKRIEITKTLILRR